MADRLEPTCPGCGEKLGGHIGVNNKAATPTPGAVALCVCCRTISLFTSLGTLRTPTVAEMDELLTDPTVVKGIQAVAEFHRRHGAPSSPGG